MNIIRKLHSILSRHSLLTMYKSFTRPHLDYLERILTNPTMNHSNIKHTWLLLGPSKENHAIKCITNWVSNHLYLDGKFKDYVCCIKQIKF